MTEKHVTTASACLRADTCIRHFSRHLIAICAALCLLPAAPAQTTYSTLSKTPIAVLGVRDLRNARMLQFLNHPLIGIDAVPMIADGIPDGYVQPFRSEKQNSVMGVLWYHVHGEVPAFEQIRFQEVVDQFEVRRMLERRKRYLGSSGKLSAVDDTRFRLTYGGRSVYQAPPGVEPGELAAQTMISRAPDRPGYRVVADVVIADGEPQVESSWEATELYRYQSGLLFDAPFEEFLNLKLPLRESLTTITSSNSDITADLFADRIPQGTRQLAWDVVNAYVGTYQQQRTGEFQEYAAVRESILQVFASVARGFLLDVEHLHGALQLPSDEQQSYRAELHCRPRRESRLVSQLKDLTPTTCHFEPVLHDNAAATLHTCFRVSEETSRILTTLADWVHLLAKEKAGGITQSTATAFGAAFKEVAKQADIELLVKAGWTQDSRGVIYGGLLMPGNVQLLDAVRSLLTGSHGWTNSVPETYFRTVEDFDVLAVVLPADLNRTIQRQYDVNITHLFVAHVDSRLWVAAGAESAVEIIRQCVTRCRETKPARRAALVTANFDAEKWLSYPQDDEVGIGGLLTTMDNRVEELPPPPPGVVFPRRTRPTPDIRTVLTFGGEQQCRLTVTTDASGVQARVSLGEAVANYCLARILDQRLRWMPEILGD